MQAVEGGVDSRDNDKSSGGTDGQDKWAAATSQVVSNDAGARVYQPFFPFVLSPLYVLFISWAWWFNPIKQLGKANCQNPATNS